jgi:hypothetical protein
VAVPGLRLSLYIQPTQSGRKKCTSVGLCQATRDPRYPGTPWEGKRSYKRGEAPAGESSAGAPDNNRETSPPQDVRNSVMALFWAVEVVLGVVLGVVLARESSRRRAFFWVWARAKEIARRKESTDAL